MTHTNPYNERLFKNGLRKYFHLKRFSWLKNSLKRLDICPETVLELGCFDGKTIEYLPVFPKEYLGYDAGWENGLKTGKTTWSKYPQFQFILCEKIEDFKPRTVCEISVCQETYEHLPLKDAAEYLKILASNTRKYAFFSIPNEHGLLLLLKLLFQKITGKSSEKYAASELFYAALGRTDKVERREGYHKGFNYRKAINEIEQYFDIVRVEGIQFRFLPTALNMTIGIIAVPKSNIN